jgi:hypothetical protein
MIVRFSGADAIERHLRDGVKHHPGDKSFWRDKGAD